MSQMATPSNNSNLGKKDRREAAREKARQDREAERKRVRRNKIFLQGGVGLAVIAIAAIVMLVIVNQPKPVELSNSTAGPSNMISGGILLAGPDADAGHHRRVQGGRQADAHRPEQVPGHGQHRQLHRLPVPGMPGLRNDQCRPDPFVGQERPGDHRGHPISFLDNTSLGNRYSTRAANAAVCVANYEPEKFYDVTAAFYANQPAESTNGRTDKQILSVMSDAGAKSPEITKCVTTQKFAAWVTATTDYLRTNPFPNTVTPSNFGGTPTVFVDGQQYKGGLTDAAAFSSFVQGIAQAKGK